MKPGRWQDAVGVAAGLWLMFSPWMLGFAGDGRALVLNTVLGTALLAAALGAFTLPQAWEKCDEILIGLAAVSSPWLVEFQPHPALRHSMVVAGAAAIVMAGLSMIADRRSGGRGSRDGTRSGPSSPGEPWRR